MNGVKYFSVFICFVFLILGVIFPIGKFSYFVLNLNFFTLVQDLLRGSTLSVVFFTVKQSLFSVFFSLIIGVPLGVLLGQVGSKSSLFNFVQSILSIPFTVPTVVAGSSWLLILNGTSWLYSIKAVVLAHVFFNAPWVAWMVAQKRNELSQKYYNLAQTMGAGPWKRFFHITIPFIKGAVVSSAVHVYLLCMMSFALVLILGGGPPVESLETAIYASIRFSGLNLNQAVTFALWQLILTLPVAIWVLFNKKIEYLKLNEEQVQGGSLKKTILLSLSVLFIAPYFFVFKGVSLDLIKDDFLNELLLSLLFSLKLSIGVSSLVTVVSVCIILVQIFFKSIEKPVLQVAYVPSSISTLVLALSFWITYDECTDLFGGSLVVILFIQAVLFLPIALRLLNVFIEGIQYDSMSVARTLGATRAQSFFQVEWPRWKAPLVAVISNVFCASLGEIAAISFFSLGKEVPLPLLMSRLLSQYEFELAQIVAALLFFLVIFFSLSNIFFKLNYRWTR